MGVPHDTVNTSYSARYGEDFLLPRVADAHKGVLRTIRNPEIRNRTRKLLSRNMPRAIVTHNDVTKVVLYDADDTFDVFKEKCISKFTELKDFRVCLNRHLFPEVEGVEEIDKDDTLILFAQDGDFPPAPPTDVEDGDDSGDDSDHKSSCSEMCLGLEEEVAAYMPCPSPVYIPCHVESVHKWIKSRFSVHEQTVQHSEEVEKVVFLHSDVVANSDVMPDTILHDLGVRDVLRLRSDKTRWETHESKAFAALRSRFQEVFGDAFALWHKPAGVTRVSQPLNSKVRAAGWVIRNVELVLDANATDLTEDAPVVKRARMEPHFDAMALDLSDERLCRLDGEYYNSVPGLPPIGTKELRETRLRVILL